MTRIRLMVFALVAVVSVAACSEQPADAGADSERAAEIGAVSEDAAAPGTVQIPVFEYDPTWPKPYPNNWTIGNVGALSIDSNDHVWVAHRPASTTGLFERYGLTGEAECCFPAPPVLEIDQAGNVVQAWGPIHERDGTLLGEQVWGPFPDVEWPTNEHGIFVDDQYVWVGSSSPPSQLLKFTRDGTFVMRIGKKQAESINDTENLAGSTQMIVDAETNELFVADGYQNRRVVVFDAESGAYKRHWGAYGNQPPDGPQGGAAIEGGEEYWNHVIHGGKYTPFWLTTGERSQNFATVHCLMMSQDRLVYVCDRFNNRIQVFEPDGTFVKEGAVREETLGAGSVHAVAFSPDEQFLYVADGTNKKIWILRRDNLEVLGSFGSGGRMGGQLMIAHALAVDTQGNVYVGETVDNNRVQRFLFKGMQSVALPTGQ